MCLKDLIGIKGTCNDVEPLSGLYVNNLEGITLDFANSLADEEESGEAVIYEKIRVAESIIKASVKDYFGDYVHNNGLINYDTLGKYNDNLKEVSSVVDTFGGVRITLSNPMYKDLYIHSVKVWLKDSITTDLEIYNLLTGKVIGTKSVSTIAGEPTEIVFNQSIKSEGQKIDILIGYDLSVSDCYKTTLSTCGSCSTYENNYIDARQVTIPLSSVKTARNLVSNSTSSGLSINYSVKCSLDSFVCYNALSFAFPMYYKIGELLSREAVFSLNDNSVVIVNSDMNEELQEFYSTQFKESITNVLKGMSIPNDDCFKCFPSIKKVLEI